MDARCENSLDANKEAAISAIRRLGYRNFKDEQMKVVLAFLIRRDVFVSLPTGYRKSLCYGCLPWTFDIFRNGEPSIVLIVSPLLSLMQDQVTSFQKKGLSAAYVGQREEHDKILEGCFQLARELLNDFRREFSHLGEIRSLLPTNVHIMSDCYCQLFPYIYIPS